MLSTGTKKVIRDLLSEKRRTLTVLIAMIIGVFAVAMMTSSKSLLDRNLTENFLKTNPASFSLITDSVDNNTIEALAKHPDIGEITTLQSIWIRMKKDDGAFLPVLLYVVDDVSDPKINTYTIDEGAFPANKNEIIIERTGKKLEQIFVGQDIELHFPGYNNSEFKISGFTHDAGIAPSWMEGHLYGYISRNALPAEYLSKYPVEIKFTVAENLFSLEHITEVAMKTQSRLEIEQVAVINSEIHEPGVHMHQEQMNALMFLILNFGVLALILSCFLIINMISAIMAKEVRQIAIMKATGASSFQITRIYISTILAMSFVSVLIGTPLGLLAGNAFADFNASMLNFELFDTSISLQVLMAIILTGVFLPVLISLFTIVKSSRISVQKSLNETGIDNNSKMTKTFSSLSKFLSESVLLAMRNAFRRKSRLALTVVSLSIGGAIFITSFNIRKSTNNAIDSNFDNHAQDVLYQLSGPVSISVIDSLFNDNSYKYEVGFRLQGSFVQENGLYSNSFVVAAIDESSSLISPVISTGRWIENGEKEVVINQILEKDQGDLKIGDKVQLSIKGKSETYTIVGISQEMFAPPGLLLSMNSIIEHLNVNENTGNLLMIDSGEETQKGIAKADLAIEKELKRNQINIVNSISKASYKTAVVEHLAIILIMLLSMTVLVVIVGGLGMATSININVSERKRELGILRAIGILKRDIQKMVLAESLTMGGISWIAAVILAIPLSAFLGNEFFSIFFESSMNMSISISGILFWILLSVLISAISSIAPANRVIKGNIPNALNYE